MAQPTLVVITTPESNVFWRRLVGLFGIKYANTPEEMRGLGVSKDMKIALTVGRREPVVDQRHAVVANLYPKERRGSMKDLPVPQDLIRQVTGLGNQTRRR